jgi:proteic killer suppression protein
MIQSYKDAGTEDIFNGLNTKAARKVCPEVLWKVAVRKLDQLDSVTSLHELKIPPGNRLEALSGDRQGQYVFVSMTSTGFALPGQNRGPMKSK